LGDEDRAASRRDSGIRPGDRVSPDRPKRGVYCADPRRHTSPAWHRPAAPPRLRAS